ncbi:MAG: flagellar basal body P-ring formation chaperone FlgA [Pseudomonadota bacterium]
MIRLQANKSSLLLFFILTLIPALSPSLVTAAEIKVVVKNQVQVRGEKIFLKDLAEFHGPDDALKRDLAGIYITRAPRPGSSTLIRRAYLEHRVISSGLPHQQAEWRLPEQIVVERESQTITEAWVRKAVKDYLAGIDPYRSEEWELLTLRTSPLPQLPAGDLGHKIILTNAANPSRLGLNIFLLVDGREAGHIQALAVVDLKVETIVAARMLDQGQQIKPGDLKVARLSISQITSGALSDMTKAHGLVCRRRLQAGQSIAEDDLNKPNLVNTGDLVTIVAQSGQLKVTSRGRVKNPGAVGENVTVINLNSKKTIVAKVVDAKTVRVSF